MLDPRLVPTRLIETSERPPVIIVDLAKRGRLRTFYTLRMLLAWGAPTMWLRLRRRLTVAEQARSFREVLEHLGGLWLKVGQLLSLRIDIFSREFCQELARLQDSANGFPNSAAVSIIEQEIGSPLDDVFDYFGEQPFAAASIGQIYRAHLKQENVWVAVKVRRPDVTETFRRDLKLIHWLVRFLNGFRIFRFLSWAEGLMELQNIANEELDYRFEATAMRRMKKTLRRHNIYVPKVFSKYTTERLLVTEFIHAALMADFIKMYAEDPVRLSSWLRENNIDPHLVSRRLVYSLFRQLFEDNLFHGDLHPGNILLLRNSRVAFIDLGTIGFTDEEFLHKMRIATNALVTRDYSKAADVMILLARNLPAIDLEHLKVKLVRSFRVWATRTLVRELPYHEKSLDRALVDGTKIMVQHKISVDWAFLRIRRALTTLDSALIHLYPGANYTRLMAQYFRAAEQRSLERALGRKMIPGAIKSTVLAAELQSAAHEQIFYQGSIVRRQAQVFQSTTGKFSYFFAIICGQLAALQAVIGFVFLLVFLHQHHTNVIRPIVGKQLGAFLNTFPPLDYQMWLFVLLLMAYFCRVSLRLRKKFAEVEVQPERR